MAKTLPNSWNLYILATGGGKGITGGGKDKREKQKGKGTQLEKNQASPVPWKPAEQTNHGGPEEAAEV